MRPHRRTSWRGKGLLIRLLFPAVEVLGVVLVVAGLMLWLTASRLEAASEARLPSSTSTPSPTPTPVLRLSPSVSSEPKAEKPAPEPSIGAGRLLVPAIGFDAPLLTMAVSDGEVNPPTFSDAYLVTGSGYGTPHGAGTVYVAMHSGRGLDAVGNALIDIDSATSTVSLGAVIDIDAVDYVVTDVRMVEKANLPTEGYLWQPVDGRAVIFTCLQRPAGRSKDNVVIIAERAP